MVTSQFIKRIFRQALWASPAAAFRGAFQAYLEEACPYWEELFQAYREGACPYHEEACQAHPYPFREGRLRRAYLAPLLSLNQAHPELVSGWAQEVVVPRHSMTQHYLP